VAASYWKPPPLSNAARGRGAKKKGRARRGFVLRASALKREVSVKTVDGLERSLFAAASRVSVAPSV